MSEHMTPREEFRIEMETGEEEEVRLNLQTGQADILMESRICPVSRKPDHCIIDMYDYEDEEILPTTSGSQDGNQNISEMQIPMSHSEQV